MNSARGAHASDAAYQRFWVAKPRFALADHWRSQGLAQLGDLEFGEYYEPLTAEPLGSHDQSWTAAVALDWVAEQA